MKVGCRILGSSLLLALVSLVVGCGGSASTVSVSGVVTLDGDLLEGAGVTFYNDEWGDSSGLTDAEGRYTLRVTPGDYKVAVSKVEGEALEGEPSVDDEAQMLMAEFEGDFLEKEKESKQLIPERFSDLAQTTLNFTVPKGGTTEANFTNITSK